MNHPRLFVRVVFHLEVENKRERVYSMSRIVTIHPAKEIHRYGFESTQVYRARIARHLGLEYVHLVSSPQLRPDWKKDLIKLGFLEKELLCVPHSFLDIGHADLSVKPESLTLADGD